MAVSDTGRFEKAQLRSSKTTNRSRIDGIPKSFSPTSKA
jgi:hypothetical protein